MIITFINILLVLFVLIYIELVINYPIFKKFFFPFGDYIAIISLPIFSVAFSLLNTYLFIKYQDIVYLIWIIIHLIIPASMIIEYGLENLNNYKCKKYTNVVTKILLNNNLCEYIDGLEVKFKKGKLIINIKRSLSKEEIDNIISTLSKVIKKQIKIK